ncbi:MAG: SHOCT domain-containing protein [Desulfitobacteriaceae bacterium]
MMRGWGNMMGGWGYGPSVGNGGFWWMGLMGMAIQLIFWVAIIALGIYLFKRMGHSRMTVGSSGRNNALDILKERYARGEIDADDYQHRKQDLLK